MTTPKLMKLHSTKLQESGENYGWKITCYEDATNLIYFEIENGVEVEKSVFEVSSWYDIQVFEEAIRIRKLQLEDEND